jgi:hypothetical protein
LKQKQKDVMSGRRINEKGYSNLLELLCGGYFLGRTHDIESSVVGVLEHGFVSTEKSQ